MANALEFPTYTFRDHPFHALPQYNNSRPSPVVVQKYFRYREDIKLTTSLLFAPRSAHYNHYPSLEPFASPLDALFIPGTGKNSSRPYVEVHVNHRSRVFLLLNCHRLGTAQLKSLTSVTGLSTEWGNLNGVRSASDSQILIGDPERLGKNRSLPRQAAVVDSIADPDHPIMLPHPGSVKVNNRKCHKFTLLFADPHSATTAPFESPRVPENVTSVMTGFPVETSAIHPNQKCPDWLHDMHMTQSRDVIVAAEQNELPFWRTWHPPIDPVFWCYYDHEHGSFPGKYRPMFDYTAWKTFDPFTSHNRQDESHQGFKTFSFSIPHQSRFVVIVVHMHLSRARRFSTRHHTLSFAVLDRNWELEMELHMKMDFGAAIVTLRNKTNIAINANQKSIVDDLKEAGVLASRRFNVVNLDENYPTSVDTRFAMAVKTPTASNLARIRRGIYEQWRAPLNTCSRSSRRFNRGFNFDVRNPATGLRSLNDTSNENMQTMSGDSVNRFIHIANNLTIGTRYCRFNSFRSESGISLERSAGVFYTDAYFSQIQSGGGKNSIRQFIKAEFEPLEIAAGHLFPVEPWNGHMEYTNTTKIKGRRMMNTENAVIASEN